MVQFARHIIDLDDELSIFGPAGMRPLSALEKQAIRLLRNERAKFDKSRWEKD